MKSARQKLPSTQSFTEIEDIKENVVMFSGGAACLILQVTAVNFALLSKDEQDAKIFSYAQLLNSLSFPIQIVARSRRVYIVPYLKALEAEEKNAPNPKMAENIKKYRDFIEGLSRTTTVLDKQFFVIIPFTPLELSTGSSAIMGITSYGSPDFFKQIKTTLETKAGSLTTQIERLGVKSKVMEKEALIKLFYDLYNQDENGIEGKATDATDALFVTKK